MRGQTLATAFSAAGLASAATIPTVHMHLSSRQQDSNPFAGKEITPNPEYAEKLETVYEYFQEAGDAVNAGKTRDIQQLGTFFWVSNIASLPLIDDAIAAARARKSETGQDQVVGLVLYNLPDRDCSAGESSGELESGNNGLARYKAEYVDVFASKVAEGTDLTFAIVVEPDALPNVVTNAAEIPFCETAAPVYEEGIAYAIAQLQSDNVNLYLDAAHGGWLGWDANLEPCKSLPSIFFLPAINGQD
jgi:cellulose 1,4-beta-cellobiosidase